MITAVSGTVQWQGGKNDNQMHGAVKAFVKVRDGDMLMLGETARVQIVYFKGGCQETWQGNGLIQLGSETSAPLKGELSHEIRTLPPIMVSQLAKMPSPDGIVKAGMIRVRSLESITTVGMVDSNYADMRQQADAQDHNPELYLLAAYFELHEFDRVEDMLNKMRLKWPDDPEVFALENLYQRSIRRSIDKE